MAYPVISELNEDPFFITAYQQGALPSNEFSFFLSTNGSELFLGGKNPSLYDGTIEFHDVQQRAFWQISGAKATVNGAVTNSSFDTIIDSGTSTDSLPS
jgi:cathepsin D